MKNWIIFFTKCLIINFVLILNLQAQVFKMNYTDDNIVIDGVFDEDIWQRTESISGFLQNKPEFGQPVSFNTALKAVYSNEMIFFSVECEDPEPEKMNYVTKERDGAVGSDDSFVILLDTFNDKRNAYLFAINPRGVQFDLKIIENGKKWRLDWNGDWKAVCKINEAGWTAEIGIPFNEIAFDRKTTSMGFNAIRNIPRNEEEALLILNHPNIWDISKFGQITNFDLSKIESKNYSENLLAHKNAVEKIKESFQEPKDYLLKENLFYKSGENLNQYETEQCFLDLYLPKEATNFPVMVWFYGGSLESGSRKDKHTQDLAKYFAHSGLAVAVVDYRHSPEVKYPAYIEDAAASVAWIVKHIKDFKGNPNAVFIGGHSAGGYLTYMLGMDRKYLENVDVTINEIAGLIPVSGQTFTHYAIRSERGIPFPETTPIIDEASPCYHNKKSGPPILAICGSKDSQIRIEENKYFLALLKEVGYDNTEYFEAENHSHWELVSNIPMVNNPVSKAVLGFVFKYSK